MYNWKFHSPLRTIYSPLLEKYQQYQRWHATEKNDQANKLVASCLILYFSCESQIQKRVDEERRWFLQSSLILIGFVTSLFPIFIFYILSITSIFTPHPYFQLTVWILFFSGATFNFLIYNFLNPSFRKKFNILFCKQIDLSRTRSESSTNKGSDRLTSLQRIDS